MLGFSIHMVLHVGLPWLVARWVAPAKARRVFLLMIATMAVDLDHLVADPIVDPNRCSIGFHPLHSGPALTLWILLAIFPQTRWVGVGLLIHMAVDSLDCLRMAMT